MPKTTLDRPLRALGARAFVATASLLLGLAASCSGGETAGSEPGESSGTGDAPAEPANLAEATEPEPVEVPAPDFVPTSPNLLGDPATEAGRAGWTVPPGNPPAVQGFAWKDAEDGGAPHLHLPMRASEHGERSFGVYGPSFGVRVAEWKLGPEVEIPAVLHGRYRVNEWVRHSKSQTLQVVLSAAEPGSSTLLKNKSMEVSVVLFGSDRAPTRSSVRRFEMVGPVEPVVGEWVDFHVPLRDLFESSWNSLPSRYSGLRFLLEARFDALVDLRIDDAVLDVEFEDLYLGEG